MKPFARNAMRRRYACGLGLLCIVGTLAWGGCTRAQSTDTPTEVGSATRPPYVATADPIDAGRYLVVIGGCNDCHTGGYETGTVPESEWLTGTPVGFRGPWGTSYPSNLRLQVQDMPEDAWVEMVHVRQGLPPMPWASLNHLSEADARAIYRYIHALGPKGERMPTAIGPDQEPTTPYFDFVPQHMERLATAQPTTEAMPPASGS